MGAVEATAWAWINEYRKRYVMAGGVVGISSIRGYLGPCCDANEVIVFGAVSLVVDYRRSSEVGSRQRSSEDVVEVRRWSEHKERTFELLLYESET